MAESNLDIIDRQVGDVAFDEWRKLLYGLSRGECILLLGPDVPLVEGGERRVSPVRLLIDQLSSALSTSDSTVDGVECAAESQTLAQVAQRFLNEKDGIELEMQLSSWHQAMAGRPSQVHDDLAAIPFQRIVTTSHDGLMEAALRRAGKEPVVDRYNFLGKNSELLAEPSVSAPSLFHLYGTVAEPSSIVLSETQLLDYLTRLSAKNPPLPRDIDAELTNGRFFLFVGFGLCHWYLRILLHVLKLLRGGVSSFAVEPVTGAPNFEDSVMFYRDNFGLGVYRQDIVAFANELRGVFEESAQFNSDKSGSKEEENSTDRELDVGNAGDTSIFICHANENADRAKEIHDVLLRSGMNPWLDKESLYGGDDWDDRIERAISEANFFVVLNSKELDEKTRQPEGRYVNKEIRVAKRNEDYRRGAFIIPVKIDDTDLYPGLESRHAVDLTKPAGLKDLVRSIKRQLSAIT